MIIDKDGIHEVPVFLYLYDKCCVHVLLLCVLGDCYIVSMGWCLCGVCSGKHWCTVYASYWYI